MLFTLAAVVYAAFRAGSNTGLFRLDGSDAGDPSSEVRHTQLGARHSMGHNKFLTGGAAERIKKTARPKPCAWYFPAIFNNEMYSHTYS